MEYEWDADTKYAQMELAGKKWQERGTILSLLPAESLKTPVKSSKSSLVEAVVTPSPMKYTANEPDVQDTSNSDDCYDRLEKLQVLVSPHTTSLQHAVTKR